MLGPLCHIPAKVGRALIDEISRYQHGKRRPVQYTLYAWLVKNQDEVMPKSLICNAIGYAMDSACISIATSMPAAHPPITTWSSALPLKFSEI